MKKVKIECGFNDTLKFKFNSGLGAIVCTKCNTIIKTGNDFTEDELKAIKGEIKLPAQYCDRCKNTN